MGYLTNGDSDHSRHLICHSRQSTGLSNKINNQSIPLRFASKTVSQQAPALAPAHQTGMQPHYCL